MPQKKNPDSLELIRGKTGRIFGSFSALYVLMKGLPMTYNRDMQEDKEQLFDAAETVQLSLAMATEVARGVTLRPHVSEEAAAEGWLVATDLAEALAREGYPFHSAHKLVGRLVLHSVETGKKPGDWTPESLAAFAPEFREEHAALLDPREGMKTREAKGGTGPAAVRAALANARARLASMRERTPIW